LGHAERAMWLMRAWWCARRYRQPAVTSDPDDLRRLDSDLQLEVI
jgi:hypothetical protein